MLIKVLQLIDLDNFIAAKVFIKMKKKLKMLK